MIHQQLKKLLTFQLFQYFFLYLKKIILKQNLTISGFLFIFICQISLAQNETMEKFDLGKYGVGFKKESVVDFSRNHSDSYRTVQLFIWYPTNQKDNNTLLYERYFSLDKPSDSLIQQEIDQLNESGKINVKLSNYKKLKTIAQLGAPIVEGNFPLLLFAPGGNTSGHLHSVICEYLASFGYIVVSLPSLGNVENERWPFNQIGLDIHIDDMALVINHLKKTMSQVNIDKTGMVSWSVGGVSQAIYCMKNQNIDFLISLDSGLGRTYGIEMVKDSHYFDYKKFDIPYLHMTGKQPEMYQVERNSEFLDSIISSEKYSIEIEPFAHQHFAAQLGIIPSLALENKNQTIIDAYIEMCRLSLFFADMILKNEENDKVKWSKLIEKYQN